MKCLAYVCVFCEGEAQGELLEVRDEVKIVLSKEGFIFIYIYVLMNLNQTMAQLPSEPAD